MARVVMTPTSFGSIIIAGELCNPWAQMAARAKLVVSNCKARLATARLLRRL
jgi:hypothetical protein